jgi:hypothetical protein
MNKEIIEKLFPGTVELISKNICPTCKKNIVTFRDKLSEKEYNISGMCQNCQDKVFGK